MVRQTIPQSEHSCPRDLGRFACWGRPGEIPGQPQRGDQYGQGATCRVGLAVGGSGLADPVPGTYRMSGVGRRVNVARRNHQRRVARHTSGDHASPYPLVEVGGREPVDETVDVVGASGLPQHGERESVSGSPTGSMLLSVLCPGRCRRRARSGTLRGHNFDLPRFGKFSAFSSSENPATRQTIGRLGVRRHRMGDSITGSVPSRTSRTAGNHRHRIPRTPLRTPHHHPHHHRLGSCHKIPLCLTDRTTHRIAPINRQSMSRFKEITFSLATAVVK